jgi:hypothetical protein
LEESLIVCALHNQSLAQESETGTPSSSPPTNLTESRPPPFLLPFISARLRKSRTYCKYF